MSFKLPLSTYGNHQMIFLLYKPIKMNFFFSHLSLQTFNSWSYARDRGIEYSCIGVTYHQSDTKAFLSDITMKIDWKSHLRYVTIFHSCLFETVLMLILIVIRKIMSNWYIFSFYFIYYSLLHRNRYPPLICFPGRQK